MKTKTLSLIAASIASLALASTALAAGAGELPTARVRYGDLNLSSDAGVAALYSRLRHAAKQVCMYSSYRISDPACVSTALNDAVAKVANGRLTMLHERRTGVTQVASTGH